VAVYCLLTGLLVGTVYERTSRARSSSLHLLLMGQLSVALTLSVFVNKFNNTASWYLAVMTTAPFWVSRLARVFRRAPR
jgi:ABC-type Mn2+/Zn2+ transport system permease subunit